MTQLQVWKEFFQETDEVNIINLHGEFKFQASHLCKVLGYKSTQVALQTHCEDYEIIKLDIGQHYDVNFVSESGFYSLVLGSQKPKAKQFKKWVCRVVLPKLRAKNDQDLNVVSLTDRLEGMQERFQSLLDAENFQIESLKRSLLNAQSEENNYLSQIKGLKDQYKYAYDKMQFFQKKAMANSMLDRLVNLPEEYSETEELAFLISGISDRYYFKNRCIEDLTYGVDYVFDKRKSLLFTPSAALQMILNFRSKKGVAVGYLPKSAPLDIQKLTRGQQSKKSKINRRSVQPE